MSGLFYFKSTIPLTTQKIFLQFIEHPIAKIYKKEVLYNNKFVLKYAPKPKTTIYERQRRFHYYSGVSYLWWSKYLVRDNEVYLPDEFDINEFRDGDQLIDATEDYIIN